MGSNPRLAYEQTCRTTIIDSETRLEELRHLVERSRPQQREDMERQLDHLRGALNRAGARIEAMHSAPDATWNFARASADEAIAELQAGIESLEERLGLLVGLPAE